MEPQKKLKEVYIIRIENPFSFRAGFMIGLIRDAFKDHPFFDPDKAILELQDMSTMKHIGIFAGQEGLEWKSLVIVSVPNGQMTTQPRAIHLYNSGSAKLRRNTVKKAIDWIRENGYNTVLTANMATGKDTEFRKLFRWIGEIKKIGTYYQFDFKE